MSEFLQSGLHPDADQLCAFVEQALPADERERTLAHLAVCPECRAVVALALPPLADEPAKPLSEPARSSWFSGWNLAWTTAAALAATIVFTVYLYRAATGRNAPGQMAHSQPAAPTVAPVRPAEPLPARPASPQPIGRSGEIAQGNAGASNRPSAAPALQSQLAAPSRISRDFSMLAAPHAAPGESGVAANNFMAAKEKASAPASAPTEGFAAGGMEAPGGSPPQHSFLAAQPSTEKKVVSSAGVAPQAEAFTLKNAAPTGPVTVSADNVTVQTAGAPAGEVIAGTQVRGLPLTGENFVSLTCVNAGAAKQKSQCPEARLPSHLPAISTVAQERLVLAIDAHNGVFVSRDAGKRWKTVRAPWTGRAVKAVLVSSEAGHGPEAAAMPVAVGAVVSSQKAREPVGGKSTFTGAAGGSLSGSVTDSQGAAVAGASVVVVNTATDVKQTVKTDSMGRYLVSGLAPGVYTIRATAPGFKNYMQTGVTVEAHRQIAENLALALGAVTETVTVQADAVQVETTSPALGETYSSEEPGAEPAAKRAAKHEAKPAAAIPPSPVFEITTDSGERWTSADGLTWIRR